MADEKDVKPELTLPEPAIGERPKKLFGWPLVPKQDDSVYQPWMTLTLEEHLTFASLRGRARINARRRLIKRKYIAWVKEQRVAEQEKTRSEARKAKRREWDERGYREASAFVLKETWAKMRELMKTQRVPSYQILHEAFLDAFVSCDQRIHAIVQEFIRKTNVSKTQGSFSQARQTAVSKSEVGEFFDELEAVSPLKDDEPPKEGR